MHKLAIAFSLLASPALATGLEIEVAGEANGTITIDLLEDVAPGHVERITTLAEEGAYDGVVFHRVTEGFMAQTGDVEFGKLEGGDMSRAGMGGSELPDLEAEFSDEPFERGVRAHPRAEPDLRRDVKEEEGVEDYLWCGQTQTHRFSRRPGDLCAV